MLQAANGQMGSFGNNKCGNATKSNTLRGQHSSGICGIRKRMWCAGGGSILKEQQL